VPVYAEQCARLHIIICLQFNNSASTQRAVKERENIIKGFRANGEWDVKNNKIKLHAHFKSQAILC